MTATGWPTQKTDGGIWISTESCYLDSPMKGYQTVPEGAYALLKIQDRGIGISPEDLQHIFEPFYTKKVMGRSGTGLGMAVVWGTVQDHRGAIQVASEETDRVQEAQRLGARGYLKKPYTLEKVGLAFREELNRIEPFQ